VELQASDGDTAVLLAGRYQHSAVFDRLIAATDSTIPLFSVTDQAGVFIRTCVICTNCMQTFVDFTCAFDEHACADFCDKVNVEQFLFVQNATDVIGIVSTAYLLETPLVV